MENEVELQTVYGVMVVKAGGKNRAIVGEYDEELKDVYLFTDADKKICKLFATGYNMGVGKVVKLDA